MSIVDLARGTSWRPHPAAALGTITRARSGEGRSAATVTVGPNPARGDEARRG
ncbi:MAG: hypothetical protein ACK5PP_07135 [Acidimicrobiales bacterium]